MLLAQPIFGSCLNHKIIDIPILGVSKEPNAFGFQVYQKPANLGYFQTKNPEKIASHGMNPLGTFATSSFFPFPKVSESIFATGIAAFYQPLSYLLNDSHRNELGYDFDPEIALCVVYGNSLGNLYSYTLVACPEDHEGQARPVVNGPLGSCAVPIPDKAITGESIPDYRHTTNKLVWTLSNSYPNMVDTKYESFHLPPNQYRILEPIATSLKSTRVPKRHLMELNHQQPSMSIGPFNQPTPKRRPLIAYFPVPNPSTKIIKRRRYKVKHPSEDLQNIVAKLRSRD
jgi:hypothetical protein